MSSAAPPNNAAEQPLMVRLQALAQTLQFAWFVGHLTLLITTLRYTIAILKFSANTTGANIAYRLAFLSAAATYGIVVYKAYRARFRAGTMPTGQQGVVKILGDENVQYLLMAFCWLYSTPVYFALFPFAVYSTFHFLSYLRSNLLPVIAPTTSAEAISRFVKKNYDTSMHLVANLEILLWARVFLYALFFQNSWILLAIYTLFLRARYAQSAFIRDAMRGIEMRGDAVIGEPTIPEGVKNAWNVAKTAIKRFGEVSNIQGAPAAQKTQ
ncbi:hypothetical protein FPQ18DRAFT_283334 [Pyronema domesticum]|uniref:Similar to Pore membrane protein of 33 kDa acc. no. Q12164 n=1 Tax=Pyronema omphalodes (strain CBS 100304) TaxID=1076935 RepID=U4LBD0_PYROM|nr:hypothetical protein FPQ18DRAFT_283334 [Pyronema domesticum]CCX07598.1 Similar to Pore membrane protein of 33 kDa; acc. no. Q12164 [Pyronema omphalodes CBS 100304]